MDNDILKQIIKLREQMWKKIDVILTETEQEIIKLQKDIK